jgi:cell division protein FtsL
MRIHITRRLRFSLQLVLILCCASSVELLASPAAETTQVDAGQAMKAIGRQRWFDRQTDTYAPPSVEEAADNPIRTDGWVAQKANDEKIQQAKNDAGGTTGKNWNWGFPSIDPNLFSSLVIALLAAVLIAVIVLLTYHSLRNYMPGQWQAKSKKRSIDIDPAKVSALPFEVQQASHIDPLAQTEALMRSNDYSQAIICLYGYMLLALDHSRWIDLQRGKTNRMYLKELRHSPDLYELVQFAMSSFEEVYFGKRTLSREQFLVSWNSLDRFHQLASRVSTAADQPTVTKVVPA